MKIKLTMKYLFSTLFIVTLFTCFNSETHANENVNLCLVDSKEHGEMVEKFTNLYYRGFISYIDVFKYPPIVKNANKDKIYDKCSVVNYSWNTSIDAYIEHSYRITGHYNKRDSVIRQEYEIISDFLDSYNGIIVTSAGNELTDAIEIAPFSRYKYINKQNNISVNEDRIYVIGQIEKSSNGGYIHRYAYGEYIDFMVDNYKYTIGDYWYIGTSFSAGAVSGLFSEMIKLGIDKDNIRENLIFKEKKHGYRGIEYKVLDIDKTLENAKRKDSDNK